MRWLLSLYLLAPLVAAELRGELKKLSWLVGKWRSEFSGKVFWPTVPTMTYGEELIIQEAPMAKSSGIQFLNFSARAWSHSTKDHFHDEWGFLTVNPDGNATLMTTGNNGFTTYEEGFLGKNEEGKSIMRLDLKDIGRISFSRDLPVENLRRTFIQHDDVYMEQVLEMRTATHPKVGLMEHTRVIYQRLPEPGSPNFGSPDALAVQLDKKEESRPAAPVAVPTDEAPCPTASKCPFHNKEVLEPLETSEEKEQTIRTTFHSFSTTQSVQTDTNDGLTAEDGFSEDA